MNLEQHFDACFCINLQRRTDRKEQSLAEIESNFGTASGWVKFWQGYDHPTSGHHGCTRSHRELLRHIAKSDYNKVLVLEDDFAVVTLDVLKEKGFSPGYKVWDTFCQIRNGYGSLNERFSDLIKYVPDYDVLYLGAGYGEPPIERINRHVLRCGFMQTTSSYGITREFAKQWTEKVDRMAKVVPEMTDDEILSSHPGPIDNVFGSIAKEHRYYVFQPRLMYQRESMSDITGQVGNYLYSMTDSHHENMLPC